MTFGLLFSAQCKIKTRPLVWFRFRPYPSAMLVYDTLDNCQADTSALRIIGTMKTLENTEQFIIVRAG